MFALNVNKMKKHDIYHFVVKRHIVYHFAPKFNLTEQFAIPSNHCSYEQPWKH